MFGSFILDDIQRPNSSALFASGAQKKAAVTRRAQQDGTRRGEVSLGVEIPCNSDSVLVDCRVYVVIRIDIDSSHKLDELSRLRAVVAACLVQRFADEVERHSNFLVLQVRLS